MSSEKQNNTIIELLVNNHSGVMSHITGLFSRRGFNLESIICSPVNDTQSKMYLLVDDNDNVGQMLKHLDNLYDVIEVKERRDYNHRLFSEIHDLICKK